MIVFFYKFLSFGKRILFINTILKYKLSLNKINIQTWLKFTIGK